MASCHCKTKPQGHHIKRSVGEWRGASFFFGKVDNALFTVEVFRFLGGGGLPPPPPPHQEPPMGSSAFQLVSKKVAPARGSSRLEAR